MAPEQNKRHLHRGASKLHRPTKPRYRLSFARKIRSHIRHGERRIAAALLNHIVAQEPANEAGANYSAKNRALLESEAAKLVNDKEVAEIAGLLYAAEIMLLSFSRNPDLARSNKLTERANELGFWITNPYALCGINDPGDMASGKYFDKAVRVIAERAKIVAANRITDAELVNSIQRASSLKASNEAHK
jgi:hypothetical protein